MTFTTVAVMEADAYMDITNNEKGGVHEIQVQENREATMTHTLHYEEHEARFSGAFQVRGYRGIAWSVLGWETEPDEDTEWSGIENRTGQVVAIMIGDDRRFTFERG